MSKDVSVIIKYLFLYAFAAIALNICKNEILLQYVASSVRNIARVSSYVSLVTACFFAVITLFVIGIVVWYLLKVFKVDIQVSHYSKAAKETIILLMAGELLKFSLVLIFLRSESSTLTYDLTLSEQLKHTTWYKLNTVFDIVLITAASIFFAISLKRAAKISVAYTISVMAMLLILMLSIQLKW